MHIPLEVLIGTSLALLGIGIYGILVRRSLLRMIIALEIAFNAGNLSIISFVSHSKNFDAVGRSAILVLIATEACALSVMLAILINIYRVFKSIDVSKLRKLRW